MPALICHYDPKKITTQELKKLGRALKPIIANAVESDFTADDVDWLPMALDPAADVVWPFQFYLETIGFDQRIARLNEVAVKRLKMKIVADPQFPERHRAWFQDPRNPLIWVRPQDQRGVHE